MDIVITQEAFNSYLDLKHRAVISRSLYQKKLRPDIWLLRNYPGPTKFQNGKFWSPASGRRGVIRNGFKMKWHNIGPGRVQLRLPVGIINGTGYLSRAYVKDSEKKEKRQMARFDAHLMRIRNGIVDEVTRL